MEHYIQSKGTKKQSSMATIKSTITAQHSNTHSCSTEHTHVFQPYQKDKKHE